MADCFSDRRDPTRTVHTLPALLAQRVAGIALGYEDINDHDALRHDPACKLLADCGGEPATGKGPPALAGKSTLNRIEHAWDTGDRRLSLPFIPSCLPTTARLSGTDIILSQWIL